MWCLKGIFFLFEEERGVSNNEPICIRALQFAPHKSQLRMMLSGNRRWSTLWRMAPSMHHHTMPWKLLCKSSDMNSRNPIQTLRSHNLSLLRLPCPLKCMVVFCLILSIKKHLCWENVEQTTNTCTHIHPWKL